jgi:hypothetical protein
LNQKFKFKKWHAIWEVKKGKPILGSDLRQKITIVHPTALDETIL